MLASENKQISGLLAHLSNLGAVGTQIAQESGQNAVDDADDLLPVVQQLDSVSSQLAPDLSALASFEAETPKIAPGDYLQVNAIVNVLLPAGGFEPTPLDADVTDARTATASASQPLQGARRSPTSWPPACGERGRMSQKFLPRMIALAVVIVVGVYYIVFNIMQYHITSQPFPVTVVMPTAGGLYTGADVTYRGVQVGTVTALDLQPGNVAVKLAIQAGQQIPDNGPVRVKELSALGEQYLDLQPTTRLRTRSAPRDRHPRQTG